MRLQDLFFQKHKKIYMKSLIAKTDNSVFLTFLSYHVFIVLVSCNLCSFFNLIKITQLQFD